jgi:hypothetical protein
MSGTEQPGKEALVKFASFLTDRVAAHAHDEAQAQAVGARGLRGLPSREFAPRRAWKRPQGDAQGVRRWDVRARREGGQARPVAPRTRVPVEHAVGVGWLGWVGVGWYEKRRSIASKRHLQRGERREVVYLQKQQ